MKDERFSDNEMRKINKNKFENFMIREKNKCPNNKNPLPEKKKKIDCPKNCSCTIHAIQYFLFESIISLINEDQDVSLL